MTRTRRGRSTERRHTRPAPVAASTSDRRVVSTGRRRRAESVCPLSVWRQAPVNTFQTLSVRSVDPDTMRPFGSAATPLTCAPRGVDEQSTHSSTGRRRRASLVCPVSVWRHSPLDTSHTLSLRSHDPDTTWPFGRAATQLTCAPRGVDERSTARFDWTPAPRPVRVPGQRLAAVTGRHVPDPERAVVRSGHDAAVRQDGDAKDLRPSRRRRAIAARCGWTPAPR